MIQVVTAVVPGRILRHKKRTITALLLFLLIFPADMSRAKVLRVKVDSRETILNGREYGLFQFRSGESHEQAHF